MASGWSTELTFSSYSSNLCEPVWAKAYWLIALSLSSSLFLLWFRVRSSLSVSRKSASFFLVPGFVRMISSPPYFPVCSRSESWSVRHSWSLNGLFGQSCLPDIIPPHRRMSHSTETVTYFCHRPVPSPYK